MGMGSVYVIASTRTERAEETGNFSSGGVRGCQADPFLSFHGFVPLTHIHHTDQCQWTVLGTRMMTNEQDRRGPLTLGAPSLAGEMGHERSDRQLFNYNRDQCHKVVQVRGERHRAKTGELTCPPSWTILKLKPEFWSPGSRFAALPTGSQSGQQYPDRGLGGESSTESTMVVTRGAKQVATSLQLP